LEIQNMKARKITEQINSVLNEGVADEGTPIVGIIAQGGKSWTVQFKPEPNLSSHTTSSLSGYGGFPFSRFPNIPVIDLSDNLDVAIKSINQAPKTPRQGGDLKTFLAWYRNNGIKIINDVR
jgi:hypothetical protein